jgi:pantoate--beta-alanine ligase
MYVDDHETWVVLDRLTRRLEGNVRPTHFQGVATVVSQLFHIIEPQRAYFGQKDAQQVVVIDRMIRDLHYPVELRVVETVREPDGVAMSSRNTYLSPEERLAAPVLRRSLDLAERLWLEGERDAERIRKEMTELIEREPLARLDYVSIADTRTLDEIHVIDRKSVVSLAVRIGKTRLIDNAVLPPGEPLLARRPL